jgi:hypothetical protein
MRRDILFTAALTLGAISYYMFSFKPAPPPIKINAVEIDPEVFKKKAPPKPVFTRRPRLIEYPMELPPYEKTGFGHDTSRNTDAKDLDDYLQLPLDSDGRTYNDTLYDLDEPPVVRIPERVRYLRMKILETRSGGTSVSLGALRFFHKNVQIPAKIINPHTGEGVEFPWTDADQRTLLIGFSHAVELDKYDFLTSSDEIGHDPVHWTLEGSMNGTFWELIDEWDELLPTLRSVWIPFELEL